MAAPFRQSFGSLASMRFQIKTLRCRSLFRNLDSETFKCIRNNSNRSRNDILIQKLTQSSRSFSLSRSLVGGTIVLLISGKLYWTHNHSSVFAGTSTRPEVKIARKVRTDTDNSGLKLTLYQYQPCPFCCKVRAVLDYHGFNYDVVEVNSVTRKQIKWSEYAKVPILVAELPNGEEVIMKDSSVIMSVLESYLHDRTTSLAKFNSFFPAIEDKSGRKTTFEFPNKYFVMFQEKADLRTTAKQREEERKWRKWADDNLIHMISPNVYRTVSESLQAFHYFSDAGEWEQNFSTFERYTIIYVGAAVMYVLGFILKNKYRLKDDVRESLFDSCNEWTKALGKNRKFMGGDQPNLADLAVYGILHSIEGCPAFQEALQKTKIGSWYRRTKEAVENHHGSHPLNTKPTPSDNPTRGKK